MPLGDRYREIAEVLDNIVLPRRYKKGDPRNIRRVLIPVAAIHQWKVSKLAPAALAKHRAICHTCRVRVPKRKARA